ncbi:MAG: flagellar basal-body rod protein FlgF [Oscillospiraceae bacterium]|nr:flagellar basal-body rod protein FlgF [Oscillospiraceae bacterium]
MQRGLYIAGTGMMVQRRAMENVTNNITNVETTGFKKNYLITHSFDEVMLQRINDLPVVGRGSYAGPLTYGTLVDQIYMDFSQGSFEETGLTTDLAIAGDGFFVMETPAGDRYTRSGAFALTVDGFLCDPDGHYLLGQDGRVWVGTDKFTVTTDGTITVDGEYVNTIRLVGFADNNSLRSEGHNLFNATQQPGAPEFAEIRQGFLENSNVGVAREMVDMLTVFRAYETNQRILSMIDETLGKAVNEIGGLR